MYRVEVSCENCGYRGVIEVVDGELVEYQVCPTCGCKTVKKQYGTEAVKGS